MQQFYSPYITPKNSIFNFDEQESKHIARVLRKISGDSIQLTDGMGTVYYGTLEVLSQKKCLVHIDSCNRIAPQNPYVHMAVAPTKSMDRFEWFVEKATELGVQRITPLLCDHSSRKNLKLERCSKIAVSALKQSLRAYMPTIDPLTPIWDFKTDAAKTFMAHCADTPKKALKEALKLQSSICILIGPEGDFSTREINWATEHQIEAIHLGHYRLRTETAALAACHASILFN